MPDVVASIEHLADLELYSTEKAYCVLVFEENRLDGVPTSNLAFERIDNILISDIRNHEHNLSLEQTGFTVLTHTTGVGDFKSLQGLNLYQEETRNLLKDRFQADCVVTWDIKLRDNEPRQSFILDLQDWTKADRLAQGAHNDVTRDSGPNILDDHLPEDVKALYRNSGFRFRIVNTWRPLLPIIEDSPLALCDFRSIDKHDLIACDRVVPTHAGEVYYLRHNPTHKWHWIEQMTPDEMYLFIMFDSAEGPQARYCPHAPFSNPRAPPDAPKRKSIETRSIVITKMPVQR